MARIHLGCCDRHRSVCRFFSQTLRPLGFISSLEGGLRLVWLFWRGLYIQLPTRSLEASTYWVSASTRSRSAKIRSYPRPILGRWFTSSVRDHGAGVCAVAPHLIPTADEITAGEVPYSVGFAGAESLP